MNTENKLIAEQAYDSFIKFWEILCEEKPEFKEDYKACFSYGIIWFAGFNEGYDFHKQRSDSILDRFELN